MNEVEIKNVLRDWVASDDGFRERLLQRCLSVLDEEEVHELDDSDLDMLAAAGSPYVDPEVSGGCGGIQQT